MNWYKLLYVCWKSSKVSDPTPIKRESNIEHINVCITNERHTEGSFNEGSLYFSESCNSIISDLSTIDEV